MGAPEFRVEHDVQWGTSGILPRPCADSFKRRLESTLFAQAKSVRGVRSREGKYNSDREYPPEEAKRATRAESCGADPGDLVEGDGDRLARHGCRADASKGICTDGGIVDPPRLSRRVSDFERSSRVGSEVFLDARGSRIRGDWTRYGARR